MNEKKYKVKAPLGNTIVPKDEMTEKELREFAIEIIEVNAVPATENEVWREKMQKDSFELVVEWLTRAGYEIQEV